MSELDISIVTLFKQYYPNIDHTLLDNNVLAILIENMFEVEKSKYSDSESEKESDDESDNENNAVIDENYMVATNLIPNMIDSGDMVMVKGLLNKIPVNILFDSGCQTSTTFTSIVTKANLVHLVDLKSKTYCNGINGVTKTHGMIWCTQLELKTSNDYDNYISVPIKLSILDDTKDNKHNDTNSVDILIGTDFMKASNVMINFSKNIITLNDFVLNYNGNT